jgi:hypothetical protein
MPVLSFVREPSGATLAHAQNWSFGAAEMKTTLHVAGWLVAFLALLVPGAGPQAQERPKRFSIWDIHLGDAASAIPDEFVNYACGTNGGPPSVPLLNFAAFKKCKPDADGLHEVYFEYDDELEYQARALDIKPEIKMYAGTTVFEFPIVASVLFDESGRVRGERMVTDPRQQVSRDRLEFWELGNFVRQRFGDEHWACRNLPPDAGETAAASKFIKNHCEKTVSGVHLILEQHLFQKKGMQFIDPNTGAAQPQAIESSTRFEMYDPSVSPVNSGTK